jgi:hypothetical protein
MLECEEDEKYVETYISYVTVKQQKRIIEKVGNRKQPGNRSRIFKDKRRIIQKGAVIKAIDEGKPSVDVQKIESDIMKVQAEVDGIEILKNTQLMGEELNKLFNNFYNSDRGFNFNTD